MILQDRYYSSTFTANIYYDIRKIYLIYLITHICINMFQHSFLLNKSSYRNVTPLRRQITVSASYGKPNCKTSFVQFNILNKLFLLLCYETPVRFPGLSSIYIPPPFTSPLENSFKTFDRTINTFSLPYIFLKSLCKFQFIIGSKIRFECWILLFESFCHRQNIILAKSKFFEIAKCIFKSKFCEAMSRNYLKKFPQYIW